MHTDLTANFAAILLVILVMHNGVDHLAQRDGQAACKVEPGWRGRNAALGHGAEHGLGILAAVGGLHLLGILTGVSFPGLVIGTLFVVVSHAFIDRRWPIVWFLEHTGSASFAQLLSPVNGKYLADQAAHWMCALIAAVLIVKI